MNKTLQSDKSKTTERRESTAPDDASTRSSQLNLSHTTLFDQVTDEGFESSSIANVAIKDSKEDIYTDTLKDSPDCMTNVQTENTILPDLLPSFEMYENLHSNIPHSNFIEYIPQCPPFYETVSSSQGSSLDFSREPNIELIRGNSTTSEVSLVLPRSSTSSSQRIPRNTNNNNNNIIEIPVEKVYSLPKVDAPVSIELYLTKHPSTFGEEPEYENVLKEFTSNDLVHGYFIVENISHEPIKFDMFYLTLEGKMVTLERTSFRTKKSTKRFLRMVDLAASWSYFQEDVNSGAVLCGTHDNLDNSEYGLSNDRVLTPGERCKKFFNFKIPNQLLDTTCKHEFFSHSLLPPTLGYDRLSHSSEESFNLEVNEDLGYGRLPERGSPIVTADNAEDNSISYSIDARLVGKDSKTGEFCILSESKHSLRVIPFGFPDKTITRNQFLKNLNTFELKIEDKLNKLKTIFSKVEASQLITKDDIGNSESSSGTHSLKTENSWDPTKSKNVKLETSSKKHSSPEDCVESEMKYSIKTLLGVDLKTNLLKSFKTSDLTQQTRLGMNSSKNGLITIKAKIPTSSLQYWAPPLIKERNEFSCKNKHAQKNWIKMHELLSSEENETLQSLSFDLMCIQAANCKPHAPPELESITAQLLCVTEKSDNCMPVEFDTETLLNEKKYNEIKKKFKKYQEIIHTFETKFQDKKALIDSLYVRDRANQSSNNLMFDGFFTPKLINDVQSLANMNVHVKPMRNALKYKAMTPCNSLSNVTSLSTTSSNTTRKQTSKNSLIKIDTTSQTVEWKKITSTEYRASIFLAVSINNSFKGTLLPTFKACLCSRSYVVRAKFNFKGSIGSITVDVPVKCSFR